jgi:hypothetical protein
MNEYKTGALYLPDNATRQARAYLDGHNPKHAPSLWFVVGHHDETARLVEICGDIVHHDPYDLLDTARHAPTRQKMRGLLTHTEPNALTREVLGIAIFTTGWASPLPADYEGDTSSITPASQHPERRRVEVLAFDGWGGASASVRFDDAEEINGSGGVGSLADGLSDLWAYLVGESAESGTQPPTCYFCGTLRPLGAALHQIRTCPVLNTFSPAPAVVVTRYICETCERGEDD